MYIYMHIYMCMYTCAYVDLLDEQLCVGHTPLIQHIPKHSHKYALRLNMHVLNCQEMDSHTTDKYTHQDTPYTFIEMH